MINILFQDYYFANYGLNLIESLACIIFGVLLVRVVSMFLLDAPDEITKNKIKNSIIYGILCAWYVSLGIMFFIAFFGWYITFFQWINNIYFTFALIAILAFPFYKFFMGIRFGTPVLIILISLFGLSMVGYFLGFLYSAGIIALIIYWIITLPIFLVAIINKNVKSKTPLITPESKRLLLKRYLVFIVVSWIVVGIFLSFEILGIPIGNLIPDDSILPTYDVFLLGFQWAFFAVIFLSILTIVFIRVIPLDKRPPKTVIRNSSLFGAVIAFGAWSIQIIVVEVILSRFLSITLYQQDIRILAIAVAIIYFVAFIIFLKFKFLPQAIKTDKELVQKELLSMESEGLKTKDERVILKVNNLVTNFFTEEGVVHAVEGVTFEIYEGEVLGLVGETGCGKSVTALSILQLLTSTGKILDGVVEFEGEDLLKKSISEILTYRGDKITMIFQDPLNSLNPVYTVGKQISEVYFLHKRKQLLIEASNRGDESIYTIAREWSEQLLRDLNIPSPESIIDRYPHELSGGMRQRIQIAMGIAGSPRLLIADEPTTALDVTVQNQILKLMKDLRKKYNTAILFITHDLGIISKMCDRVAVMYSGSIVEYGETEDIFTKPYHPYTRGLLAAIPIEGEEKDLIIIPGMVPNLIYPPSGCRFHPRCAHRFLPCDSVKPKRIEVAPNYYVACHLYDPQYSEVKEVLK